MCVTQRYKLPGKWWTVVKERAGHIIEGCLANASVIVIAPAPVFDRLR